MGMNDRRDVDSFMVHEVVLSFMLANRDVRSPKTIQKITRHGNNIK